MNDRLEIIGDMYDDITPCTACGVSLSPEDKHGFCGQCTADIESAYDEIELFTANDLDQWYHDFYNDSE